jgi:FdhE protein
MQFGVPLISCTEFAVDYGEIAGLLFRLIQAVESMPGSEGEMPRWKFWQRSALLAQQGELLSLPGMAKQIRMAQEDGRLDLCDVLCLIAENDQQELAQLAGKLALNVNLLNVLAQYALKPVLFNLRQQLSPLVADLEWGRGYCYICGANATLGELQDNDQEKHLRCGQCGADWLFNRLLCAHCGNTDHASQHFIVQDDKQSLQRTEVCDLCKSYIKVITSFSPTPPDMLPVEDLATVHLDIIAAEHGYVRAMGNRPEMP